MSRTLRTGTGAALAMALVLLTQTAAAQSRPDFSGSWALDTAKSDGGGMMITARTDRFEQTATQLKVTRTLNGPEGAITATLTYGFDGAEYANTFGPVRIRSKLRWAGAVLIISSVTTSDQGEITSEDRFSLSVDGKVLTMERSLRFEGEEMIQKLIFNKV